jgi:1-acyl-sn-glycerol-3-phosphate acyltransferase
LALLYTVSKFIVWVYLKLFRSFEVKGQEYMPAYGPVILVANHVSNLDPPAVGVACPRRVHFMAKHELFINPVSGWFLRALGAFPVKRNTPDRAAFKQALNILKKGLVLGMFPEGTRNKSGELGPAQQGAAVLALRTQAILIPVGVRVRIKNGKDKGQVQVRFGPAIPWDDLDPKDRSSAQILANRIMIHIAQLLEDPTKA